MNVATAARHLSAILRRPPGIQDGPLYPPGWCGACGKVGCSCPSCHGAGYIRVEDATVWPTGVAQRECDCGIVAGRQLEALQALSVLRDFETATFEAFEPRPELAEALAEAQAWAASPRGWLVLHGEPGSGKTHLAAAAGNVLRARGELVAMHVMPALLRDLRGLIAASETDRTQNTASHDLLKAVQAVPILILDDLGAEYGTRWAIEQTYLIVEERYRRRLPLCITTNTFTALEPRVRDRLTDEGLSVVVGVRNATSYRQWPTAHRRGAS